MNLNRLKIYFWVTGILKKLLLTPSTKLFIRLGITSFGPSKCPVYVRLPWIGSPSQLIADKVSSSVTHCYNAARVRTIFTTWAAFRSIHKDVLPVFKQSNLIHKFQCCCNATYIGCTSQRLKVRVKQHVPGDIPNRTTSAFKIARFYHL